MTMNLLNTNSLAATVDAVNDALFLGRAIPAGEKQRIGRWLASRHGVKYSYAGLPAPTETDLRGVKLFTGELVTTGAGVRHAFGEEALRIMLLLNVKESAVKNAISRATDSMFTRMSRADIGTYCCGKCSVAMWRTLLAGGFDNQESRLANGIRDLSKSRDGKGWGRYPFYYTLLALSEMDSPAALVEMRYAAPALKRTRKGTDKYSIRRAKLAELILARI
jgi:hypothetical protein